MYNWTRQLQIHIRILYIYHQWNIILALHSVKQKASLSHNILIFFYTSSKADKSKEPLDIFKVFSIIFN